ncbi:MAG: response regulator [Patescibacteria group bacterium]|nr:response regulator [Patescibacteria group bacterium]
MEKILVVEDDQFLCDLYKSELEKLGYEVVQAYDGLEALSKISSENPDLMILDLVIPEYSGIEVLKQLKIKGGKFKNPIVVLSNMRDEKIIEEATSLGAVGYVIKSRVTPETIGDEVKKYLPKQK